jgi:hypothetical protein
VPLDKGLVLAAWWLITRSMVIHCLVLGVLIIAFTPEKADERAPSYNLILHWVSLPVWGTSLIVPALVWLFARGWLCVLAGLVISIWFFAFASAFFTAWTSLPHPGTTPTGWVTYGFLGWAWLCVTVVVIKDEEFVRTEERMIEAQRHELDQAMDLLIERGGHPPEQR